MRRHRGKETFVTAETQGIAVAAARREHVAEREGDAARVREAAGLQQLAQELQEDNERLRRSYHEALSKLGDSIRVRGGGRLRASGREAPPPSFTNPPPPPPPAPRRTAGA